jgi:hypothetical protein
MRDPVFVHDTLRDRMIQQSGLTLKRGLQSRRIPEQTIPES